MKKIITIQIFLLVMVVGCLGNLKSVQADIVNEVTTTQVITIKEDITNDIVTQKDSKVMKEKIPKVAMKFAKKKLKIKKIELLMKTSVKISWKKQKGANGYILYKKSKNGKFVKLKKITNKQQIYYVDNKVKYNNVYTYAIKAYKKYRGKTYYSDFNKKGMRKKIKVKSKYKNGYKYFYDMDNHRINNMESFLVNPSYCLKVNLIANVMTVYAKDGKKGYTIPVKAYLCSGNTWDKTGTFSLGAKYRFRTLYYNCYSQWSSRIHDDILFHTVPYTRSQDPNSLDVKQYNLLGTSASHGCIRLQCVAVKWINDKCPSGTKIVMYKSENPGALGKPKLEKIPLWHTWDPTDLTMQYKCKKAGCQHEM